MGRTFVWGCALVAIVLLCGVNGHVVTNANTINIHQQPQPQQGLVSELSLDWNTMRTYFMYSMASFCTPTHPGLANWTCSWCTFLPVPKVNVVLIFEGKFNSTDSVYGYVGYTNESIVIAFRGSDTIENWIEDFEFWHTPYADQPSVAVHYGFYHGYLKVQQQIVPVVQKLQSLYPNLQVVSTGHSFGAALSVLAGVDLVRQNVQNVKILNYGEPRVGNQAFADYAAKIVDFKYRVVNRNDIVPHLPPQDVGYTHISTEVWFPTNSTYYVVCDPNNGEDPTCSDSITPIHYSTSDHLIYLGYGPNGLKPANGC